VKQSEEQNSALGEKSFMSIKATRHALLWCLVINYGLLVVWFLLFVLLHESLHRYWGRWFSLSAEQFDFLNFAGMMLLKIFILVFNLVPYVALRMIGRATRIESR
jgi:hypothetical protein